MAANMIQIFIILRNNIITILSINISKSKLPFCIPWNLIDNHKSQIVIIRLYVLCENSNHFDFDLHIIQSYL